SSPVSEAVPADAPGQLASHYAPRKPMMLLEPGMEFTPVEGVRYGLLSYEGTSDLAQEGNWAEVVAMSPGSGRLAEAAVRLFALMRQMDEKGAIDVIVAEPGKRDWAAPMERCAGPPPPGNNLFNPPAKW
ncbi:MAG: Sua5 family C-terminal domain-containing protein, partial [Akkermansia sp.]